MKKNEFVILCDCGCSSGISFTFMDSIFVGFFRSISYDDGITSRIKKTIDRDKLVFDIIITPQDIIWLINWLENVKCTEETGKNFGKMEFEYESKYNTYSVYLYADSMKNRARAADFTIDEDMRVKLIDELYKLILSKEDYSFRI